MNYLRLIMAPATVMLIVALSLTTACKKTEVTAKEVKVQTPVQSDIRFIRKMNGSIILGGGEKGSSGFLMEADSIVRRFTLITDSFPLAIYQGTHFMGRYVFSNEKAEIFYSYNLASFFPHWLRDDNFVPVLHQRPGRAMVAGPDNTTLFIVSGGELQYGLIQQSPDTFQSWYPTTYNNELRALCFTPDGTGWACGLGILLRSDNGGQHWERQEFDRVHITAIDFSSATKGVLSTIDASFYYTEDGGNDWRKATKRGKAGYVNRLKFLPSGKCVAVGSNGTICVSDNNGKSWDCDRRFQENDLYDFLETSTDRIQIAGEKGIIWQADL